MDLIRRYGASRFPSTNSGERAAERNISAEEEKNSIRDQLSHH